MLDLDWLARWSAESVDAGLSFHVGLATDQALPVAVGCRRCDRVLSVPSVTPLSSSFTAAPDNPSRATRALSSERSRSVSLSSKGQVHPPAKTLHSPLPRGRMAPKCSETTARPKNSATWCSACGNACLTEPPHETSGQTTKWLSHTSREVYPRSDSLTVP